jgi:hypothetical protein
MTDKELQKISMDLTDCVTKEIGKHIEGLKDCTDEEIGQVILNTLTSLLAKFVISSVDKDSYDDLLEEIGQHLKGKVETWAVVLEKYNAKN